MDTIKGVNELRAKARESVDLGRQWAEFGDVVLSRACFAAAERLTLQAIALETHQKRDK